MDFEAAERERIEGEMELKTRYALEIENSLGNQYLMPSGTVVEADDTLYDPVVLSDNPAELFGDWPGEKHLNGKRHIV